MHNEEQGKLITALVESMSVEEAEDRRYRTDFTEAFLRHVTEGDVEYYLDRLLTVADRLEVNRKEKENEEAWALRERQDSVDAACYALIERVREHLPTTSSLDLEMNPTKTRIDLYVKGTHAKTLIFDKQAMGLSTTLRGALEDVSGWDTDMEGWDQSEIMRQFVTYVEGNQEKEKEKGKKKGTGC